MSEQTISSHVVFTDADGQMSTPLHLKSLNKRPMRSLCELRARGMTLMKGSYYDKVSVLVFPNITAPSIVLLAVCAFRKAERSIFPSIDRAGEWALALLRGYIDPRQAIQVLVHVPSPQRFEKLPLAAYMDVMASLD